MREGRFKFECQQKTKVEEVGAHEAVACNLLVEC